MSRSTLSVVVLAALTVAGLVLFVWGLTADDYPAFVTVMVGVGTLTVGRSAAQAWQRRAVVPE